MEATSDRTETAAAEALRRPIDLYCQHLHRGVRGSLAIGYLRQISDDQDQLAALTGRARQARSSQSSLDGRARAMRLYIVEGIETLHPDLAPHRLHIALASSEAVARQLVEQAFLQFKIASVELVKEFAGDEVRPRLYGWVPITHFSH